MGEASSPSPDPAPDSTPSNPSRAVSDERKRALITTLVIVVFGVGGIVAWPLLRADRSPNLSTAAVPSASVAPTAPTPDSPATATPPPSETASEPAATDTEAPDKSQRVTALHSDLDELVVKNVLGYRLRARTSSSVIDNLGGEGERLTYRRKDAVVSQVIGLFSDSDAAGAALQRRFRRLTRGQDANVEFDEPLRDTGNNVIGRIFSVLTRKEKRVVAWSNSNLLVTIGPGRPRLMERWYQALPY